MPYTGEKKKAYQQQFMAKRRSNKGLTGKPENAVRPDHEGSPSPSDVRPEQGLTEENVRPVIPDLSPEWAHVVEFISRPTRQGDISNLEKLQRIAGSLGKLGSHVWMGSLNLEEIGRGIGVKHVELPERRGLSND